MRLTSFTDFGLRALMRLASVSIVERGQRYIGPAAIKLWLPSIINRA